MSTPRANPPKTPPAQPRILVVDDDRLMLTLLLGVLRQEGYTQVDRATGGKEALEKCQTLPPDIIFLDIEMPEMSGIETLQAMQQQGITSQVVLVSASPTTQYVMAAKENRAAGFVVKPLSPKIVSDAIAVCLKNAHPGSVGVKT